MPTKKTSASTAEKDPKVSDKELLKQKKAEAKTRKETEKEEKKIEKAEKKKSAGVAKDKQTKVQQRRNPLKLHGKKYRAAAEKIQKDKAYPLAEAIKLIKATSVTKFDAAVEIHTRLGINTKKSDQVIRSAVALPHGTGKKLRIIAFVAEDKAAEAKKLGAIEAGETSLIEKIAKGWLDFDVAIATPEMMKSLGKIAKTLGQKGLMPNPKAGTVTPDIGHAIAEIQKGKVEFRNDAYGILHNLVGKVSFEEVNLIENIKAYLKAVNETKPKAVKGAFIQSISLASSMGPGIRLDTGSLIREL